MSERLVATFSRAALLAIAMLAFVMPAHADDDAGSITNVLSDLCLDAGGGQVREFAPVVQSKCDKDKSQQWILKEGRTGTRVITAKKELCLDIEGRSTRPGARVIVTECRDDAGQQWRLVPSGAGYQAIMVRSGLCLAIAGDSQARGAQAIQQQCSTGTARLWQLDGPISAASTKSKWSNRIDLPLIPVSAANLPDGRVLLWAADAPTFFSAVDQGRTYSAYFDPGSERVSQRIVTETGHDMFCPGLNLLPDGTVMVTGGLSSGKTI